MLSPAKVHSVELLQLFSIAFWHVIGAIIGGAAGVMKKNPNIHNTVV